MLVAREDRGRGIRFPRVASACKATVLVAVGRASLAPDGGGTPPIQPARCRRYVIRPNGGAWERGVKDCGMREILVSPFQGSTSSFTRIPRALPWAGMFRPLRGTKCTNSRHSRGRLCHMVPQALRTERGRKDSRHGTTPILILQRRHENIRRHAL